MEILATNDEFLHKSRMQPRPQFAHALKIKLDRSSTGREPFMSAYLHASAPFSRRGLALCTIVAVHTALILALMNIAGPRMKALENTTTVASFPKMEQPPSEASTLPPPKLETFAIPVPQPPTPIEDALEAPAGSAVDETLTPLYSGIATENSSGSFVRAGMGRNFPDPDAFYPPSAIRQEIEGKAIVRVCVGPDGKLVEAPQIARSTQHRVLDDAALRLARTGAYVAGSRDGVPITDCFNFQTTFTIKGKH